MATKRSHSESEGIHSSRQSLVYDNNFNPAKKARQNEPSAHKKRSHTSSVNDIKKRIRDVTRRMERVADLPADVRAEDERALAAYQQELTAAEEEKTRQKMISKYHMVRFFERQKATRQLKKLRKRLLEATAVEEVEELKIQMHIAEVDLNYTQYHPLNEIYISLYPQKKDNSEDAEASSTTNSKKPAMWAEVEKSMENGTLDILRNGTREAFAIRPKPTNTKPKPARATPKVTERPSQKIYTADSDYPQNRRERRKAMAATGYRPKNIDGKVSVVDHSKATVKDDGNISDGGFFEE